ncbi:MAG: flagellar protein FliT [bacterium]|nr:flagellar protein FliT [bacterium]
MNYLNVLEESLERKLEILAKLKEYCLRQQEVFQAEEVKPEKFDEYADKKSELIDELTALDDGFETLYQNVSRELQGNREAYAEQIRRMQELVTRVTEESVTIQAQEARNKKLVEEYFRRERVGIAQNRKSSKAAYDYYRSMSKSGAMTPNFMDSKQ